MKVLLSISLCINMFLIAISINQEIKIDKLYNSAFMLHCHMGDVQGRIFNLEKQNY